MEESSRSNSLWSHLAVLARADSEDSLEYILQTLWTTRKAGLNATDRRAFLDLLQLQHDSDLDPLLVCLRKLIRRCVYENVSKDDIQKLFPDEVLPELQRLLTLPLQKFQKEWRGEVFKDQDSVALPRLKAMTWKMENPDAVDAKDPVALINLKLQNDARPQTDEWNVKFQVSKDTLETTLKSMYSIRDQLSDIDGAPVQKLS